MSRDLWLGMLVVRPALARDTQYSGEGNMELVTCRPKGQLVCLPRVVWIIAGAPKARSEGVRNIADEWQEKTTTNFFSINNQLARQAAFLLGFLWQTFSATALVIFGARSSFVMRPSWELSNLEQCGCPLPVRWQKQPLPASLSL